MQVAEQPCLIQYYIVCFGLSLVFHFSESLMFVLVVKSAVSVGVIWKTKWEA